MTQNDGLLLEEWKNACVNHFEGTCSVVKDGFCIANEKSCPFHKTEEEAFASFEKWEERMRSLPIDQQQFYADVYYGGIMLWDMAINEYG